MKTPDAPAAGPSDTAGSSVDTPTAPRRDVGDVALIGGGRMGRALAQGMVAAGILRPERLCVAEPNASAQAWWRQAMPAVQIAADTAAAVATAPTVLVAVKPGALATVADQAAGQWSDRLTISVAAGVTLARLEQLLASSRVVRVMPNTPSLVGAGASAYCCGPKVGEEEVARVEAILGAVGFCTRVDEPLMDAVTGLSGSGPAFVCLILEALADGGVLAGLSRELALQLATQTVLGTAQMVQQTGQHPAALKDAVASPGGTTIAGLHVLEQNALRGTLIEAVRTAAEKSRSLGG